MKKILHIILVCTVLLMTACGPKPQELFDTAELEMLQTNYPHAEKLYKEIIDKFPKSEFADQARTRLAEIKVRQAK